MMTWRTIRRGVGMKERYDHAIRAKKTTFNSFWFGYCLGLRFYCMDKDHNDQLNHKIVQEQILRRRGSLI